jgi:hypothetical protein
MKDLNNELLNKTHMVTGMSSEFFDELVVAINSNDDVNYREELGDMEWFCLGYMKWYGLSIPTETTDCRNYIYQEVEKHFGSDYVDDINDSSVCIAYISHTLGVLNAILKKEITSGVRKYDGQEVTNEFLQQKCEGLLCCLMILSCYECNEFHKDVLIFPAPIHAIRQKIHEKLVLRHSGKAMTTESDLG